MRFRVNFNWRRFLFVSSLIWVVCVCAGCTASWIGAINALLPALGTAVEAIAEFIAGLEGKTLSAEFVAGVNKIIADIQTELQNLSTVLASITGTVTETVTQQIETILNAVVTNLGSILSGANITDSATVTKLTQLIGIGVSAVEAILALIPVLLARLQATPAPDEKELGALDQSATHNFHHIHDGLKSAYRVIIDNPTDSADVNATLKALPQSLP